MSASTEKKLRIASREAGTDKKTIAQQEAAQKKAKEQRRLTIGIIAAAVVVALVLLLSSPLVYTATKAAAVGGKAYSPAELNYYYANQYYTFSQQYGQYASAFGLNTSYGLAGLKSQDCGIGTGTWRDYFVDEAIESLRQYKAVTDYAAENGISLSEEELKEVEDNFAQLKEYAQLSGYPSVKKFVSAYYGNGVTEQLAFEQAKLTALAAKTAQSYSDALTYTPEQLAEHYADYAGSRDYFDVCYYTVNAEKIAPETAEGAEGEEAAEAPAPEATDETRAAAKASAEAILAAYNSEELSVETDVEVRLNEALTRAGVDGLCTHSQRVSGAGISDYVEWAMEEHEAGDATLVEGTDSYTVAAIISHDDNTYRLAQVRHILVRAEADEEGNYTDEAKAAAKAKAEEIYDEWRFGMKTEDSFAELAKEKSEDAGSAENGGLYDAVQKGQMVEEFDAFCFADHKYGDSAVIYGESAGSYAGYHVMFYVGEGERCCDYIAENDMKSADEQAWLDGLLENNPAEKCFWLRYVG